MWVKDLGSSRLELAVREALGLYTQDILSPGDRTAVFVWGTTALRRVHMSSNAERFVEEVGRIGPPPTLSGDAFPWDSDVATAFESIYMSLDNQDRFEEGEENWTPEERSDRLVLLFTDGDFLIDAEQMSRLDVALGEFRRRGLVIYPVGVGSRTGVNVDTVLTDYVRGVDYDDTLVADLEGQRTRLGVEGIGMLEQRTGGRSFIRRRVANIVGHLPSQCRRLPPQHLLPARPGRGQAGGLAVGRPARHLRLRCRHALLLSRRPGGCAHRRVSHCGRPASGMRRRWQRPRQGRLGAHVPDDVPGELRQVADEEEAACDRASDPGLETPGCRHDIVANPGVSSQDDRHPGDPQIITDAPVHHVGLTTPDQVAVHGAAHPHLATAGHDVSPSQCPR